MKIRVYASGAMFDEFKVTTSVEQGCAMAPVPVSLYMLCVTDILHCEAGVEVVDVRYRLDRNLYDSSNLKSMT